MYDYGFVVNDIKDNKTNTIIESLAKELKVDLLINPHDANGEIIIAANQLITPEIVDKITAANIKEVEIRSVLSCYSRNGVCQKCYGKDLGSKPVLLTLESLLVLLPAQSIIEHGSSSHYIPYWWGCWC